MIQLTQRHKQILEKLSVYGKVSVLELSEDFEVASATIRRDLSFLEEHHKLQRVHGGAVKVSFLSEEPCVDDRLKLYINEKIKIASMASRLVEDHMAIFLDIGTTVGQMVPLLLNKRNLTVITNAFDTAHAFSKYAKEGLFTGKLIFLGGEVNAQQRTVFGPLAAITLESLYVDIAFIGVGGIHLSGGLTGYDPLEVALSKMAIGQAKEAIALLDHTKIGVRNLHRIVGISGVDRIICDTDCPGAWKKELEVRGVQWLFQ